MTPPVRQPGQRDLAPQRLRRDLGYIAQGLLKAAARSVSGGQRLASVQNFQLVGEALGGGQLVDQRCGMLGCAGQFRCRAVEVGLGRGGTKDDQGVAVQSNGCRSDGVVRAEDVLRLQVLDTPWPVDLDFEGQRIGCGIQLHVPGPGLAPPVAAEVHEPGAAHPAKHKDVRRSHGGRELWQDRIRHRVAPQLAIWVIF